MGIVSSGCSVPFVRDYEEFTPAPAQIVPRADCGQPAVTERLRGFENSGTPLLPVEGSVPKAFTPVEVIRCERGGSGVNDLTIDAVTLTGDTKAVTDAFRIRSRRPPDGTEVTCVVGVRPPVALWLVAADGSAIRPEWPSVECGRRDEPLRALRDLRETRRTVVTRVGFSPTSERCAASAGSGFVPTTEADAGGQHANRPKRLLMTPTDDVDTLAVCRYRTDGRESTLLGQRTLSAADSRRVVTSAVSAPVATACVQTATQFVTATLLRADRSGGARFSAELDGCRRSEVAFVSGYRTLTVDALTLLTGPFDPR